MEKTGPGFFHPGPVFGSARNPDLQLGNEFLFFSGVAVVDMVQLQQVPYGVHSLRMNFFQQPAGVGWRGAVTAGV